MMDQSIVRAISHFQLSIAICWSQSCPLQYQMPLNRKYNRSIELGQLKVLLMNINPRNYFIFNKVELKNQSGHMMDQSIVRPITHVQLSSVICCSQSKGTGKGT